MNSRAAKRVATEMLAQLARARADLGRSHLASGFFAYAPEVIDPADTERVAAAFDELAEELGRRANGERKPPRFPAIDPDQLSWVDLEVLT